MTITVHPFDCPLRVPEPWFSFTPPILADGLRSSTDCPVARALEYVDPDRYFPFNAGVGALGHMLEQIWIHQAWDVPGIDHTAQLVVPWEPGNASHIDVVVHEGPWHGAYEVKTSSDEANLSPALLNYRQSQRSMYLCEQAGIAIPGPYRLVMIGKSGNQSGWVRGPWEVPPLEDEDRERIRGEFDLTRRVLDVVSVPGFDMDNLPAWMRAACRCSACVTVERKFDQAVADILDYEYRAILMQRLSHSEWKQAEKALKSYRDQVAVIMGDADQTHVETGFYNVSIDRRGVVHIKPNEIEAQPFEAA